MKPWYDTLDTLFKKSMVQNRVFYDRFVERWVLTDDVNTYTVNKHTHYDYDDTASDVGKISSIYVYVNVQKLEDKSTEFWYGFFPNEVDAKSEEHPLWLIELFREAGILEDCYYVV